MSNANALKKDNFSLESIETADTQKDIDRARKAEEAEEKTVRDLIDEKIAIIKKEGQTTLTLKDIKEANNLTSRQVFRFNQLLQANEQISASRGYYRGPTVYSFIDAQKKKEMGKNALAYDIVSEDHPYLDEMLQEETDNSLASIYSIISVLSQQKAAMGWIKLSCTLLSRMSGVDYDTTRSVLQELQERKIIVTNKISFEDTQHSPKTKNPEKTRAYVWSVVRLCMTKEDYEAACNDLHQKGPLTIRSARSDGDNKRIKKYEILDNRNLEAIYIAAEKLRQQGKRVGQLSFRTDIEGFKPKTPVEVASKKSSEKGVDNFSNQTIMDDVVLKSYDLPVPQKAPRNVMALLDEANKAMDKQHAKLVGNMMENFSQVMYKNLEEVKEANHKHLQSLMVLFSESIAKQESQHQAKLQEARSRIENLEKQLKAEREFNQRYVAHTQTAFQGMSQKIMTKFDDLIKLLPNSKQRDQDFCDQLKGEVMVLIGSTVAKAVEYKIDPVPPEYK